MVNQLAVGGSPQRQQAAAHTGHQVTTTGRSHLQQALVPSGALQTDGRCVGKYVCAYHDLTIISQWCIEVLMMMVDKFNPDLIESGLISDT